MVVSTSYTNISKKGWVILTAQKNLPYLATKKPWAHLYKQLNFSNTTKYFKSEDDNDDDKWIVKYSSLFYFKLLGINENELIV